MKLLTLALVASAVGDAAASKPPPPWVPCNASAGICFSENLGSNMVLQQAPAKACVFGLLGTGHHGATIKLSSSSLTVADVVVAAEVTAGVRWKACLAPQKAGGEYTITATTVTADAPINKEPAASASIDHVTFGDVFYCSGQSNMALPLLHSYSRNETRDAILAGKYQNLRIHGLAGNMNANQPWATLKQALVQRSCKTPKDCKAGTDSDSSSLMSFSATCFYFGQELSESLVAAAPPIGLVHTAWGGSTIEQWLTNETIATCEYASLSPSNQEFHDTRVLPYIDMTLKGFLWCEYSPSILGPKLVRAALRGP
jgi:sialate O-acetylesterase